MFGSACDLTLGTGRASAREGQVTGTLDEIRCVWPET